MQKLSAAISTRQTNSKYAHLLVSRRALSLWQKGGSPPGRDLNYWLLAEHQCEQEHDTETARIRDILENLFPQQPRKRSETSV
jgi:hypothetical protein